MQVEPSAQLIQIIHRVERSMSHYYGFELQTSAADYLVSRDTLLDVVDDAVCYPEWQALAAVWFEERGEDIFIAMHCDNTIVTALTQHDPCANLHNANLADFCVLVEEISHFHLLTNKAARQVALSRLELELQGEIDKVIVSADFLYHQTGECHIVPLVKLICREVSCLGALYQQASLRAAQFFSCFLTGEHTVHTYSVQLRQFLQRSYMFPWQQKRALLFNPRFI